MTESRTSRFATLKHYLLQPVDGASVAFIRVAFAATMVYWLTMHLVLDKITYNYYEPSYLFPYFGFDWLKPWPGRLLHLHFVVTLMAAMGMLMGVFYRFSSIVFAVGYIYIAMLDKATYQNHYYFIGLMAILFAICPSDRAFSFDLYRRRLSPNIPRWVLWLFQFQIGLVYFFGGVAKINNDWLHAFPMQQVLALKQDHPVIGGVCQEQWFAYAFVWSGLLFDLFIVPLLLYSRTRNLAFLAALAFHLMNASLFRIGVFPWVMIFLTTIFFAPAWARRLLPSSWNWFSLASSSAPPDVSGNANVKTDGRAMFVLHGFVMLFVLLQIALPLRHYALNEDTSWTERNHHFSWHMKLRGKNSALRFYAIDRRTGDWSIYDLRPHLKLHQLKRMGRDPFMIRDFAKFIQRDYAAHGVPDVIVRAFVLCSMNGRKPQLLVDPDVDLTQEVLPADWIVPLEADIGGTWNQPMSQWEQIVMRDPIHAELIESHPPSRQGSSHSTTTQKVSRRSNSEQPDS